MHQSGSSFNKLEVFQELDRYGDSWKAHMKKHKLKYMHFGTGQASHDNTMWRHILAEFGWEKGQYLIVNNQTQCLCVFQFMRNTKVDSSCGDFCQVHEGQLRPPAVPKHKCD